MASHEIEQGPIKRMISSSTNSLSKEDKQQLEAEMFTTPAEHDNAERDRRRAIYNKYRPYILGLTAMVILGWWISSIVLKATRHRWIVQTLFAWSFLLIIAFRFIPNSVVTRPVEAVWNPLIQEPWYRLSYRIRLAIGWLCLVGIIFGSAFGFPLDDGMKYSDRVISIAGLVLFQFCFWATSKHRSHVPWPTVIVGLFLQQAIALFVLKSTAGLAMFRWMARLASDFLHQALAGAVFFFDQETISKFWVFVNVLSTIIFFVAFVQMMYYLGVMQWVIGNFAWFFFKIMDVSGAEAVVAAASPWVGQGESACLVKPFLDLMTESELHLVMTSGFSTIAGSVLTLYMNLGVPAQNLITSSVMSIPASMAISKMRIPEMEEPLTRGRLSIDRGEKEINAPANALHAFSQGAIFGVVVAGQILANVLTVLSLVAMINGILTWIGRGFGIPALTLQLVIGYIFYPITFFLGVPRADILPVSRLFATKLIANEFAAYMDLKTIMESETPFGHRTYTIASYGLCGFANLGSLGIQIGVLGAMAPTRGKIIARIALSAMFCGFLSTLQTAGVIGMFL